jgi:hydroxylamine reductase
MNDTANLQDLLVYVAKGVAVHGEKLAEDGMVDREAGRFIVKALFTTITNAAWDNTAIINVIKEGLRVRGNVSRKVGAAAPGSLPDCATWLPAVDEDIFAKAMSDDLRITSVENEDVRSLRELLIEMQSSTYADHPLVLVLKKMNTPF